ncbi:MAG TPA: BTAD domain-containing putative transcriptional regulator [Acidimicrobiales bacterium]
MQNLRLRLLGELDIEGCDTDRLERRQLRTLLKILALGRGSPVRVDRLVDCLWGDAPPSHPADQVSVLVSRLRSALGANRVPRSDAGYTLVVDWLDLDALGEYAAEADRRLANGAIAAARTAASAGLSLVRGPLLADEADPWWAGAERSAVDLLIAGLRSTAASAAMTAGDWVDAAQLSNHMLATDPYDEVALRFLMEALDRSGRSASALATYAGFRQRLAEDLGVSLSAETEALHTAILLGESPGDRGPGTPASATPPAELPGRAGAISELDTLFDRAKRAQGQVGLVEGEAGIGKSRLLEAWRQRVESLGTPVVLVRCDELGRAFPFQPLFDAVAALAHEAGTAGADEVIGPDMAVLGPLLVGRSVPAGSAHLAALTDPGAGQALLVAALFSVLRRQAERSPLVLLIDDIHLADTATTAWLSQAAHRLADSRIVIIASCRAEEGVVLAGATTVALGPLDLEATTTIVGTERALELQARSGGHPLFLVELAVADPAEELPATIRDAVEERCARSGPAAATLRAAAVIGPEIYLDLLTAVTATPPRDLLDHLEEGVRRKLLVEHGDAFVFTHGLVREAMASTVGAARTAYFHREAARALGARPDADPLAVARHARLGGESAFASEMLVAAAKVAVARFDQTEALRLLDDAVGLDDTAGARLERARVGSMLSRDEQVAADIEVALSLGAGPEALEVAAWSAHFRRQFDRALTLADRGALEATDAELRTSCLALGGWISLASGDLSGASDRLEGATRETPSGRGRLADAWLAWLRMNQGHPAESLKLIKPQPGKGLAAYRFPNAYALMASTMALAMLGRVDEALATLQTLETDVDRMGAQRWVPRPLNLRGWILRNLGESSAADDCNRAGIEAARRQGMDEPLANGLLDLAAGRLMAGELDAAEALLDDALPLADVEHAFRWRHVFRGRLIRSRLDLALEDPEAALATAEALAADTAILGASRYEVQARLVAAMAGRQMGAVTDLDEVEQLLSRLDELAGLEGWWITAQVARVFDVRDWEQLAQRRLVALRARAGPHARALDRAASAYFG